MIARWLQRLERRASRLWKAKHQVKVRFAKRKFAAGGGQIPASAQVEDDKRLIEESGLFDPDWYLAHNSDLAETDDRLQHYLDLGAREGRSAGPGFDSEFYLEQNPDVRASGANPLVHYLRHGAAEGRAPAPSPDDRALIEASGLFDSAWYRAKNPDIGKTDPLRHYLAFGAREGRAPGPSFDPRFYLTQNPDVREAGVDPFLHYLRFGAAEARPPRLDPSISDTVQQLIADVSRFEPDINCVDAFTDCQQLQVARSIAVDPLSKAWEKLFSSLEKPYDYIVFVPWLTRGGADLVSVNAVRSLVEKRGADSVLYVLTDHDRLDARSWLPEGVSVRVLSYLSPKLSHAERVRLVELLIIALTPRAILNINSRACWDAIEKTGGGLSAITSLYAGLFCRDYTLDGRAAGYADTHFRSCIPYLTKVYFDNATFARQLADDYSIPSSLRDRLVVLRQPTLDCAPAPRDRQNFSGPARILWAGRFCKQKNIELLVEIATKAPAIQFDVYGAGDEAHTTMLRAANLPNLSVLGAFSSFDALPTQQYDAYLYTSLWDGIPTVIIYAATLGIPIIASDVGGIGELIDESSGWLIHEYRQAEAYVRALEEILADRSGAEQRARAMIEKVKRLHSWRAYSTAFSQSPSFLD